MAALGVDKGDVVLVRGLRNRRTVALAFDREDVPAGSVMLPAALRRNVRAVRGDELVVAKAEAPSGSRILVAPFDDTLPEGARKVPSSEEDEEGKKDEGEEASAAPSFDVFDKCIKPFFLDQDRPVHKGETFLSGGVEFKVKAVEPDPCCVVTDATEIVCDDEAPLDRAEEARMETGQVGYADLGGCAKQIKQLREMVELPLRHPEVFKRVGTRPPRGVLLYGPPGCGKTILAKAVATEAGCTMRLLHGPEIASAKPGEAESNLRKAFEEAAKSAPAIIFIDEVDAVAPKRDKQGGGGETEKRIVSQLLTLLDTMSPTVPLIVLAATNRPSVIDPALRRFGRFDREVEMGVPDTEGRLEVLRIHLAGMKLHESVDVNQVAEDTQGFCGADIAQLATDAAMECVRETTAAEIDLEADDVPAEVLGGMAVMPSHIDRALGRIQPSSLRDAQAEVPSDVSWADVGGLDHIKKELMETIQFPIRYEGKFGKFGMSASRGVLLYGPSGCGKTLIAKAIANECQSNFISVKGPELLTMWFGESEANVRSLFDKARQASPCVIFFDEMDSIAKQRGASASGGSDVGDRVINQILTEIDGVGARKNVFVIGATNRPDILDPAVMRPGRLDQLIYIPLPDYESRVNILKAACRKSPVSKDLNLKELAERTEGFSGADLAEIAKRACKLAIREDIEREQEGDEELGAIQVRHFEEAMKTARRSVTPAELAKYESFRKKYKGGDATAIVDDDSSSEDMDATSAGADEGSGADSGSSGGADGEGKSEDLYS